MAPWLRPPRVACLLLVLVAGPAPSSSYAASYGSAYAPSYAAEPAPAESRAGSRAGAGRERPGREAAPTDEDTGADHPDGPASPDRPEAGVTPEPSRNTTPLSDPPVGAEQGDTRSVNSSEPILRVLPLGSGLVLIGLGLALAFLALRVRRG
ncbi:hypothetical protein [Streptomyces sp. 2A115]|uniref:hypothetical protein n=1 Tax=Streptomyces sp. 2A115 TaxID=3457439 RepID=UPI003FD3D51E